MILPEHRRATSTTVSPLANALKAPAVKRTLYASGALAAWHRRRNRDRLTVVMFHRVLATDDPRWPTADPEYTLSRELFVECLRFFKRHYHVVALDDLLARRLPERPLLITFDDGWSDNEEYALPALRALGLPAVLFVVADAVGRAQPFWQEQLIAAWRAGRLDAATGQALWEGAGRSGPAPAGPPDELAPARLLIAALEAIDRPRRRALLDGVRDRLDDGVRSMITVDQLRALAGARVAIGAHGQSHDPLTEVPDATAELTTARQVLEGHLGGRPVRTVSFPHGRFDDGVVAGARQAGYRLCFTSVPELPRADLAGTELVGRVGFTAETITGPDGRFAPEKLALCLFRARHAPAPPARRPP
jgi:peptidoglycan/xylan/chitin deacetylase (PgdA/CDA1 family)